MKSMILSLLLFCSFVKAENVCQVYLDLPSGRVVLTNDPSVSGYEMSVDCLEAFLSSMTCAEISGKQVPVSLRLFVPSNISTSIIAKLKSDSLASNITTDSGDQTTIVSAQKCGQ